MFDWLRKIYLKRSSQPSDPGAVGPDDPIGPTIINRSVQGDAPIQIPEQDFLGVNPFAKAIAAGIASADAKDGLVYAINGAWGSGKSSAINLILHHLSQLERAENIEVTAFNPWWFSGGEALTIAFFQEMRATVGKSLDEKARDAMASLGGRLSAAGPLLGGLASLFGTPAAGAVVAGGAGLIERLTRLDSTVEDEHRKLASALSNSDKRFLIVLDDIDRLNTDDALQVFKLIKSVGRLPNVIYLMAFDRKLAEKMVADRFPAEGVSFLEKIVQGGFYLPPPDPDDLRDQLLTALSTTMGFPPEEKMNRFWNIFLDAVAPLLKTPRDVVRLSNSAKISWGAVAEDIDRADFLAVEAMRLFLPSVYEAVRDNQDMLTGTNVRGVNVQSLKALYDETFLGYLSNQESKVAKLSLQRLFPRVNGVWDRVSYSSDSRRQRDRLICSPEHFRTYFVFSVRADLITGTESNSLIAASKTPGATANALKHYLAMPRRKGGTRAAYALEQLSLRSDEIAEQDIEHFLREIFSIADEVDVKADESRGFSIASNQLRIHWLLNNMLSDRFDIGFRSAAVKQAATSASIGWIVSLSDRLKKEQNDDEAQRSRSSSSEKMVDDETSNWLYDLSIERLRSCANNKSLIQHKDVIYLLYRWRDRSGEAEVRRWTDQQLHCDKFVISIARNSLRESWSQSIGGLAFLGDRVAARSEYVCLQSLESILDIARFRDRIANIRIADGTLQEDRDFLEKFERTPERDPSR